MSHPPTTIETAPMGLFFDFADPRPEMVDVRDIARSLALQCRFNGHTGGHGGPIHYSVAEHAVLVRDIINAWGRPDLAYFALHHDSEEAYLGDIVRALKPILGPALRDVRWKIDNVVAEALGLPGLTDDEHLLIKKADNLALRVESEFLKVSGGRGGQWEAWDLPADALPVGLGVALLSPLQAEQEFLFAHSVEAPS